MHVAFADIPCQRLRQVIDRTKQGIEAAMQRFGAPGFRAVQDAVRTCEILRLTTVNLTAVAPAFIDHCRPQTGLDKHFGATYACRPGADDDYASLGHVASGCCVDISSPSLTSVEQARRRPPPAVHTQQSWQAP